MIYPIVAYGDPVLRKKAQDISPEYPDLKNLIDIFQKSKYFSQFWNSVS